MINYDIYRQQILDFLETVSIKCSMFAPIYKRRAEEKGIVVESDYENPYYLNLCGIYHTINDPVFVTTLEDNRSVLFANRAQGIDSRLLDKDNIEADVRLDRSGKIDFGFNDFTTLQEYKKTFNIYKVTNEEYKTLCLRNPTETGLIKSVVYPCKDIETAVNARDLTVLAYDDSILDENERQSLLEAMNNFLDHVYNRWYIKDYDYEETYPLAFMGMIYALLPQVLLTQRLINLRTDNVHTLHIWEYLSSHGLGEYESILTNRQAKFLYKNIKYIYRNKGKKSNIEILAENLLKDLHITLVGKTIAQNSTNSVLTCTTLPEFLNDDVIVNGTTEQVNESTKESMEAILSRMYDEGYYPKYGTFLNVNTSNIKSMEEKFSRTNFNVLDTRLLEFKKAILNTRYLNIFTEFLMDTLLYQIHRGNLEYNVKFVDKNTGMQVDISIRDALVLLHYAHYRELPESDISITYENGIKNTSIVDAQRTIPPFKYSIRIPYKDSKPTKLPTTFYRNNHTWNINSLINVNKILSDIPFDNGPFKNTEDFLNLIASQFPAMITHIRDVRQSAHSRYQFTMVYFYYHLVENKTIEVRLTSCENYQDWIVSTPGMLDLINSYNNLPDPSEFYKDLCDQVWNAIFPISEDSRFDEYTGMDRDNTAIYAGLKKLFTQLCSYRLFFLETSRDGNTFITAPYQACETLDASEESIETLNTNVSYKSTLEEVAEIFGINTTSDDFKHYFFEEITNTNISTNLNMSITDISDTVTDYLYDTNSFYKLVTE